MTTLSFEAYQQQHRQALDALTRRFHLLGYLKLALVALVLACGAGCWLRGPSILFVAPGAIFLPLLAALWVIHLRVGREMEHRQGLLAISGEYLARRDGGWESFAETGSGLAGRDHPYTRDLDIIGEKSLFQYLSTARTHHGRLELGAALLGRRYSPQELARRRQAVEELSRNFPFLAELQLRAQQAGKGGTDILPLLEELQARPVFLRSRLLKGCLLLVPLLATGLLLTALAFGLQALYLPLLAVFAVQLLVWVLGHGFTGRYLGNLSGASYGLDGYRRTLELLEEQVFESPLLQEIQQELIGAEGSAAKAVKELAGIADRVRMCHSGIIAFVLNLFLLWSYECCMLLERWKGRYHSRCEGWFLALGRLESLCSLAVLPLVCPHSCLPRTSEARGLIQAKELGHPLLPPGSRVCNPIDCKGGILLISGSNMSGKTTFLRTVGLNLVLAQAGGYVCAAAMEASLFTICTSMRIADDMKEGISTFYAELKRIRMVVETARQDNRLLFLIDEIFRGTNSADRLAGARGVIRQLERLGCTGMITTHDLELCSLEGESPRIANFSFHESYRGDEILFDYRIRAGKSTSTNARYLMRMTGIL